MSHMNLTHYLYFYCNKIVFEIRTPHSPSSMQSAVVGVPTWLTYFPSSWSTHYRNDCIIPETIKADHEIRRLEREWSFSLFVLGAERLKVLSGLHFLKDASGVISREMEKSITYTGTYYESIRLLKKWILAHLLQFDRQLQRARYVCNGKMIPFYVPGR